MCVINMKSLISRSVLLVLMLVQFKFIVTRKYSVFSFRGSRKYLLLVYCMADIFTIMFNHFLLEFNVLFANFEKSKVKNVFN